jgi:hypothetical protein
MDFRTTPEGEYNWIIQGKRSIFSVCLEALTGKNSSTVAEVIKRWTGVIGKTTEVVSTCFILFYCIRNY